MSRIANAASAILLTTALALAVGACSSGGDSDDNDAATTEPADSGDSGRDDASADDEGLTSYDDIDALHQQLVDGGVACGLEYSGLRDEGREVSLCVIEGEQALLTIWDDPSLVTEFTKSDAADAGDVAYGENWTVDVDSSPTAELIAEALGGRVSG